MEHDVDRHGRVTHVVRPTWAAVHPHLPSVPILCAKTKERKTKLWRHRSKIVLNDGNKPRSRIEILTDQHESQKSTMWLPFVGGGVSPKLHNSHFSIGNR